jgi:ABC-type sugar transport system permease subunit
MAGDTQRVRLPVRQGRPGRWVGYTVSGLRMQASDYVWCYVFVLPFVIFFLAFTVWPLVGTIGFSFFEYDGIRPLKMENFVGLENYLYLFQDLSKTFPRAIANTFYFAFTNSIVKHPLTFAAAYLLTRKWLKGKTAFRTAFFLTFLIPQSIVGMVFNFILHPANGPVNTLLQDLGIIKKAINFYGSRWLGMNSMVAISVWHIFAQYLLWWMVALQNIPEELYEAAQIDGANAWQQMRHITLPIIRPLAIIFIFLGFTNATHQLDLVLNTTAGGPRQLTYTVDFYVWNRAFQATPPRFGIASAAALLFGLITLILVLIQGHFVRRAQRTRAGYGI